VRVRFRTAGDTMLGGEEHAVVYDNQRLRVLFVTTNGGGRRLCMEAGGRRVPLDRAFELAAMNQVLRGFQFARADFERPSAVCRFLMAVALFHTGSGRVPGTSFTLDELVRDPSRWLQGGERDEQVLRELCRDPVFAFEQDKWTVTFHAFREDGAVERWEVVGRHDPRANANEILQIDATDLKPPGTFSCSLDEGYQV
jgi:hypothetical protein